MGPTGTLVVPTFTFAFCKGVPFDPLRSESVGMGLLSEAVRTHIAARRSPHPMQSIAAIGREADELCRVDTADAYEPGGVFEGLLDRDAKLLLLGATVQAASLVHLAEQRVGVPYRLFKDFTAPYIIRGEALERTYRMYARDLKIDARLILSPIEDALRSTDSWQCVEFGGGHIATCSSQAFCAVAEALLRSNPWALTLGPPAEYSG